MEGFLLKGADLKDINLVNSGGEPFHLIRSDLRRTNLQNAHLYQADFSRSNLLKADLEGANLHFTNLDGCNLLGVNWKNAKLDQVDWGQAVLQEQQGFEQKRNQQTGEAQTLFQEAEEVVRNIRRSYERQGLFSIAGDFFYREMVIRRQQYPLWSFDRVLSKLVDLVSGYGEKPRRVIFFSMGLILLFSFIYLIFGIQDGPEVIGWRSHQSLYHNGSHWLTALYYSVVTFTTLGYGDITPVGLSRLFAAMEAFTGTFTMALFVVVFVKKMTR